MIESLATLGTALGLGVGAGVNAYATLLAFGLLGRFFPNLFSGDLASFFSATPVLAALAVCYLIEFVADKIPAVDHVWDAIHTFVRPVAGAVIGLASTSPETPESLMAVASVLAGGSAFGAHAAKAAVRGASTVSTGGAANPLLSVGEDLFAFGQTVISIFLPLVALALVVLLFLPALFVVAHLFRKRSRAA